MLLLVYKKINKESCKFNINEIVLGRKKLYIFLNNYLSLKSNY